MQAPGVDLADPYGLLRSWHETLVHVAIHTEAKLFVPVRVAGFLSLCAAPCRQRPGHGGPHIVGLSVSNHHEGVSPETSMFQVGYLPAMRRVPRSPVRLGSLLCSA